MKAVVLTSFGPATGLELQDVAKPEPGPNDVLVRVHATSVNPADIGLRRGMFGAMMPPPLILGFDVAGTVEAVGVGVETFRPGDEVYYAVELTDPRGGANAEYHVTKAENVATKPRNLSFGEAAAVPVAGGTAYAALFTNGGLTLGETVLIHGAAGGVGSYAVQLARATGAFVIATCGAYDANLVKELGADVVLDYRRDDVVKRTLEATQGEGVDVVLDASGKNQTARSIPALKMHGRLVTVTGAQGDLNLAMRKDAAVHFTHLEDAKAKLDRMRPLFERGLLRSVVSAVYPLERVAEAHGRVEQGGEGTYGKVVVEVGSGG